jgi:hypothetical protein
MVVVVYWKMSLHTRERQLRLMPNGEGQYADSFFALLGSYHGSGPAYLLTASIFVLWESDPEGASLEYRQFLAQVILYFSIRSVCGEYLLLSASSSGVRILRHINHGSRVFVSP